MLISAKLLAGLIFAASASTSPLQTKALPGTAAMTTTESNLKVRQGDLGSTYTVVSGDTGNCIAAKWSMAFSALSSANPSVTWNALQVGEQLSMPSCRNPISYQVKSGDTGNSIASKYGDSFADLSNANPSVTWTAIQVGESLQVPGYGMTTTYSVASKDTGNAIASCFGISFSILSADNPNVNWSALQVGEVLQIPCGSSPSSTTTTMTGSSSTKLASTTSKLSTQITSSAITTSGEPSITQTATVSATKAVTTVNNQDGRGSLQDQYTFYSGDGSSWPAISSWESFDNMWQNNLAILGTNCQSLFGVAPNSADETQQIYNAIEAVAGKCYVDHRFILAIIMQETKGCVRAPTTNYGVRNPGLIQTHNGTGTCNDNGNIQNPCPATEIFLMVEDGAMGTIYGDGLTQSLNEATGSGAQANYQAARMYNSGSIPSNGDLGGCPGSTPCYSSDVANRLTGWVENPGSSPCTLKCQSSS